MRRRDFLETGALALALALAAAGLAGLPCCQSLPEWEDGKPQRIESSLFPEGIQPGTVYYVKETDPHTACLNVATSPGGVAMKFTF